MLHEKVFKKIHQLENPFKSPHTTHMSYYYEKYFPLHSATQKKISRKRDVKNLHFYRYRKLLLQTHSQ